MTTVLIVSERDDLHAGVLAHVLERDHGARVLRIDLRDFPDRAGSVRVGPGGARRVLDGVALDGVEAVWWRRAHPTQPAGDDGFAAYRQAECDAFVQGALWSLAARWVNEPGAERVASRKIVQLEAAVAAGLAVPETFVTSDPAEAQAWIATRPGDVVFKRTGASRTPFFSETRLVRPSDLARIGAIRSSPTTFQDFVEPAHDLRVVWVDGQVWTARIDSPAGAGRVDSRLDVSVDVTAVPLDEPVRSALDRLMRGLGLVFGVIDLRVGRDGAHHFLEVNPQGQFADVEVRTGLPVFRSLAGLLAAGDAALPVGEGRAGFAGGTGGFPVADTVVR